MQSSAHADVELELSTQAPDVIAVLYSEKALHAESCSE